MGLRWKFVTVHRQEFSGQKFCMVLGRQKLVRSLGNERESKEIIFAFQIIYAKIRTTESKIAAVRVLHSR